MARTEWIAHILIATGMSGPFSSMEAEEVMRRVCALLVGLFSAMAGARADPAAENATVAIATYIDVLPQDERTALPQLLQEAAVTRAQCGCRDLQLLREIQRPDRFLILENWQDGAAFANHKSTPQRQDLRADLAHITIAPPDERSLAMVWSAPVLTSRVPLAAIFVVTHVDVMPNYKDDAAALLSRLGKQSAAASGNLAFAALRQPERPNHFTVVEIWTDRAAFDAHQAAAATRDFREHVAPMLGALYDQRLYQAVE
jgi:quinol monooxygenase YgiN